MKRCLNDVLGRTVRWCFTVKNGEIRDKKVRMNYQKPEAFFSFRGIRGTFLIYVYIHFQYFPAEKLIVHVNGYSFRLSTKVCKENHSSQKRKAPLKTPLFHLMFSCENISFVCIANSPLFPEQQNRFNVGYADKKSLEPCKGFIKL